MKMLNKDLPKETMTNMKGIAHSFMTRIEKWIIDTRATNHIVANLDMLTNIKTVSSMKGIKVHLHNGYVIMVTHIGSCKLTEVGEVQDVLYVPNFYLFLR